MTSEVKCSLLPNRKETPEAVGILLVLALLWDVLHDWICIKTPKLPNLKNQNNTTNIWSGYMRKCVLFILPFAWLKKATLRLSLSDWMLVYKCPSVQHFKKPLRINSKFVKIDTFWIFIWFISIFFVWLFCLHVFLCTMCMQYAVEVRKGY